MSEQNQKEIDRQIAAALAASGVPQAYHKASLSDYGSRGERLKDWVVNNREGIRKGKGLTLVGNTKTVRKLFTLTARAVILSGVTTQVITMPRLQQVLQQNTDPAMLERVLRAHALFVWDWYAPTDEAAYTRWQRADLEDFWLNHIENERALFAHCTVQPVADTKWWSNSVVEMVQSNNETWKV